MLIEAVIALAIALIALGMLYMAPGWMYKTANYAEIEAALFDAGFSYAEEILSKKKSDLRLSGNSTSTDVIFITSTGVEIKFKCTAITARKALLAEEEGDLGKEGDFATFTIEPTNKEIPKTKLTFTGILNGAP